ncbi:MAG: cupin domain-containing protein [Polyangiaceae bacterium]
MKVLKAAEDGEVLDASDTMYPSRLEAVRGSRRSFERETSTVYGYVVSGNGRLHAAGFSAELGPGAFFTVPGHGSIEAEGFVVLIERFGFRAMLLAGRTEATGRLAYIDGCSDSVLSSPPRLGDPVLNHLHFPPGIVQSVHSHPSVRLGVVAHGTGVAYGPAQGGWEHQLVKGALFLLDAHEFHAFKTAGSSMDVIAYHPDSDSGPTDGEHPMLNRTYLAKK